MASADQLLTDRDREVYLDGLRRGLTKAQAASAAGRSASAFREFAKRDKPFAELERVAYHEDGRDALVANLNGVIEKLNEVDPKSAMTGLFFLIKQRDPSFRENAKLELPENAVRSEVKISLDFQGAIAALEQAGVVRRGPSAGYEPALGDGAEPAALLPARADGEADGGADGAPLAS